MNPEKLQDAISLLPNDLLEATDKLRTREAHRRNHGLHWLALAACVAILACGSLMLKNNALKTARLESASQAPAAAAPRAEAPVADEAPAMEASPAEPVFPENEEAAMEAPAEEIPAQSNGTASITSDAAPATGTQAHGHGFAEDAQTRSDPINGWCGNMTITIRREDGTHSISGTDAVAITDILINLNYRQEECCLCPGEFTVDTETLTGIQLNLTLGFARCELGQCDLTAPQVAAIQEICSRLS